jgi:hypothetical protein
MVVVVGTSGDLDEAEVRRYLTDRSRVALREPHDLSSRVVEGE